MTVVSAPAPAATSFPSPFESPKRDIPNHAWAAAQSNADRKTREGGNVVVMGIYRDTRTDSWMICPKLKDVPSYYVEMGQTKGRPIKTEYDEFLD